MASLLMGEGRFRTLLKYSAHRTRIFSLSVNSVFPSALRRVDDPEDVGPWTSFRAS